MGIKKKREASARLTERAMRYKWLVQVMGSELRKAVISVLLLQLMSKDHTGLYTTLLGVASFMCHNIPVI
jgi:hypothetical protein